MNPLTFISLMALGGNKHARNTISLVVWIFIIAVIIGMAMFRHG